MLIEEANSGERLLSVASSGEAFAVQGDDVTLIARIVDGRWDIDSREIADTPSR
jgi:hypothetical protein